MVRRAGFSLAEVIVAMTLLCVAGLGVAATGLVAIQSFTRADAVDPIIEYAHADGGVTVIGGYVYRGTRIPRLRGAYLFADYADGRVRAVRQSGGRIVDSAVLGIEAAPLSSFGEDRAGELYVLSLSGRMYRVDPA